ncbi:MAG TPA: energy transducer TonB [Candidatus Elarobacter sp.]|jgi:outer membrane biosynthesis protein TonB
MTKRAGAGRRFLAYGIALSVALHLTVLPFVHAERTVAEEIKPEVFRPEPLPTPPPKPSATPRPTPPPIEPPKHTTPAPAAHHALRIRAPRQTAERHGGAAEASNVRNRGDEHGSPDARETGPPGEAAPGTPAPPAVPATPRTTPTPLSCARPNVAATTLRALEPETPPLAQQQGISGVVGVVVSLDAQSRVVAARVQSSPSVVLNPAALAAARGSQYRTEVRNCEPVAADYLFTVEFDAQ